MATGRAEVVTTTAGVIRGREDVDERDAFLQATLPRLIAADSALHSGDARPRIADTWSHTDPVTVFGAVKTVIGWAATEPMFYALARQFSDFKSFEIEVIAGGASGDLAYLVAIEHTNTSVAGAPAAPYALRVTQVFRREGGEWKVIHRHADEMKGAATTSQSDRLGRALDRR
jgi:ketosteroid isomerase-like protein